MISKDDSVKRQDELEQDATKSGVSRRQFLTAGSAALATLAFSGRANADTTSSELQLQTIPGSTVRTSSFQPPAFQPPPLWTSENGQLADLVVEDVILQYPGGSSNITLRSYNGHIPGPTLYCNAGDQINFRFCNNLPPKDNHDTSNESEDSCKTDQHHNIPSCFSATNMHFHGLHVSPGGDSTSASDNVLLELYPGGTQQYSVQLPSNHAPGTHWYHAHRHGSTGIQVSNGMAGALIIREPSQALNMVADTEDKVWLIQEINKGGDATATDGGAGIYGIGKDVAKDSNFIVNAVYQPLIQMEAGKMQRWRFINGTATPAGFMQLVLCKCSDNPWDTSTDYNDADRVPMHLVAVDGISFYGQSPYQYPCNPQDPNRPLNLNDSETGNFQFSPGNRADFLILLPAGTYKLIKLSYKNQDQTIVGAQGSGASKAQVLAYVRVTQGSGTDSIPTKIPGDSSNYPYFKPIADAEIVKPTLPNNPTINDLSSCSTLDDSVVSDLINNKRILVFQVCTKNLQNNRKFVIDDLLFNYDQGTKTAINVGLGTAEEWILDNQPGNVKFGPSGQVVPHPFHIHVNPFQVVATGTKNGNTVTWAPVANPIWQDTVAVEPNRPLKIRHRFDDFAGTFVMHCHILIHEDQGMMYLVNINDNSQTA